MEPHLVSFSLLNVFIWPPKQRYSNTLKTLVVCLLHIMFRVQTTSKGLCNCQRILTIFPSSFSLTWTHSTTSWPWLVGWCYYRDKRLLPMFRNQATFDISSQQEISYQQTPGHPYETGHNRGRSPLKTTEIKFITSLENPSQWQHQYYHGLLHKAMMTQHIRKTHHWDHSTKEALWQKLPYSPGDVRIIQHKIICLHTQFISAAEAVFGIRMHCENNPHSFGISTSTKPAG